MSFFRGVMYPQPDCFFIYGDTCPPLFVAFAPIHAFESGGVSARLLGIVVVLGVRRRAQFAPAVVVPDVVFVVYLDGRPFAGSKQPR